MTEEQAPYLPDVEPTEASVCRAALDRMTATLRGMTPRTEDDWKVYYRLEAEKNAWTLCLQVAEHNKWRRPRAEQDTGLPGGQQITDAG